MVQAKLSHVERIMQELKAVGVTPYGMKKFAVHYLPKIIHAGEAVKGVVYGRYRDKQGTTNWNEGMLIATDSRIIFLDHKPGFTTIDELTYDVVSGINITTALFSAVTLRTRLGDYKIRFANTKCAGIFVHYVEQRRLEHKITT
jgi:hypothetical protein